MSISPDIPRIITAIAEWCACICCILRCRRLRITGPKLWIVAAGFLIFQSVFLEATGSLPLVYWIPCMTAAVILMFLLIMTGCRVPFLTGVYYAARAFLLAEFAASLEWQLYSYCAERYPALGGIAGYWLFLAAVYAAAFGVILRLDSGRNEPADAMIFRPWELAAPLLIVLTAFAMGNLSFVNSNNPFSGTMLLDIHNIRTLADLAGLAILYAYQVNRCELYAKQELGAIQNILRYQYSQYRQSRDSIDFINRRYHDLKNQIAALRAEQDPKKRTAYLDEMEEEFRAYEAQSDTGSPVLDTLLTGKNLYCAQNGIGLTCVADGSLLSFMDVMDICTIFGNLLDNAIECEMRIADREKRLIHLSVSASRGFLVIRCENYCLETPAFADGLPVTSKPDAQNHGYGLKSIRYSIEKYDGTMTLRNEDDWFRATIVFPLIRENG